MTQIWFSFLFLLALLSQPLGFTPVFAKSFSIQELTIQSLQKAFQTNQLNCEGLVKLYLERISKYNLDITSGPPLNAIVEINPNLFDEAKRLDRHFSTNRKTIGPLHCVPILLKDNIDSYDTKTSSGSLALLGSSPTRDAFLVNQLRKSGAIILGKATMDEFAAGLWGISGRSGKTGNSYDPSLNSGGSSSGSAVGVSANFALASIGTDNSGSLRIPAAYNGLYTLRPTTGLISQTGIFPRGNLDGIAGPIARTVQDLAILLDALVAIDPNDTKTQELRRPSSYIESSKLKTLKGIRIGILRSVGKTDQFRNASQDTLTLYQRTISGLKNLGADIIENVSLYEFDSDRQNNMSGEIEDVDKYLTSFPSTRESYEDICSSDRTRIFGGVDGCIKHLKTNPKKNSTEYNKVLATFKKNRDYVQKVMTDFQLDALLAPINSFGLPTESADGLNCLVASNSGLPGLSFIAGYTKTSRKLPVGMELIGKAFSEPILLRIASSYEQNVQARVPPLFNNPGKTPILNLSIPEMNHLFTKIGWETYKQVLKSGNREDLSPQRFQKITEEILSEFK